MGNEYAAGPKLPMSKPRVRLRSHCDQGIPGRSLKPSLLLRRRNEEAIQVSRLACPQIWGPRDRTRRGENSFDFRGVAFVYLLHTVSRSRAAVHRCSAVGRWHLEFRHHAKCQADWCSDSPFARFYHGLVGGEELVEVAMYRKGAPRRTGNDIPALNSTAETQSGPKQGC